MHALCAERNWTAKYNIKIGAYEDDRHLSYSQLLASSKFALVAPGGSLAEK